MAALKKQVKNGETEDFEEKYRVSGLEFKFLRENCGFNRRAYLSELGKNQNTSIRKMGYSTLQAYEISDWELKPYYIHDLIQIAGEKLFTEAFKLLKIEREKENRKK